MPVEGGVSTAGGRPLGFDEAGRRKSANREPNDPNQPPEELRPLRTFLVRLALLLVAERPGGLPGPLEPRVEDALRLVFAYWRV
jgi:hypothetical protein